MQLPTQGIPTLENSGMFTRTLHAWKLEDLAKISELESTIARNNLEKIKTTIEAMTVMATFGERVKASMENIQLQQRMGRATVQAEEAKARIMETEAKKEEFDFHHYVRKTNED